MKKLLFLLLVTGVQTVDAQEKTKVQINALLDNWHKAAAVANFNDYFDAMSEASVFIGTDATENWDKKAFMSYSKPHFDKGKAWNFTALERHVFVSTDGNTAWFDELLDTQMKICRGSGVLVKEKKGWKIKHYVLSMTIPNDNSDAVIKIKEPLEDNVISRLKSSVVKP